MKAIVMACLAAAAFQDAADLSSLEAWKKPAEGWVEAGDVGLDPADAKKLAGKAGTGAFLNGAGKAKNLFSAAEHGDVELHVEFMISKGSNSGVYFMGRY